METMNWGANPFPTSKWTSYEGNAIRSESLTHTTNLLVMCDLKVLMMELPSSQK